MFIFYLPPEKKNHTLIDLFALAPISDFKEKFTRRRGLNVALQIGKS